MPIRERQGYSDVTNGGGYSGQLEGGLDADKVIWWFPKIRGFRVEGLGFRVSCLGPQFSFLTPHM